MGACGCTALACAIYLAGTVLDMTPAERIIRTTVATLSPGSSPSVLLSTADRESKFHADAIRFDKDGEGKVFLRDREKMQANGSPYTADKYYDDWAVSSGLYQLMAPYEVQRWRADAHPKVLLNPIISTILAMRKVNRIIGLGAKDAMDIRMVWAFGPKGLNIEHDDKRYTDRVALEEKRWANLGLPGSPFDPVRKFAGVGTGPTSEQASQLARLTAILGGQSESESETETNPIPDRNASIWPYVAMASGGVIFYLAWQKTRRLPTSRGALAPTF